MLPVHCEFLVTLTGCYWVVALPVIEIADGGVAIAYKFGQVWTDDVTKSDTCIIIELAGYYICMVVVCIGFRVPYFRIFLAPFPSGRGRLQGR